MPGEGCPNGEIIIGVPITCGVPNVCGVPMLGPLIGVCRVCPVPKPALGGGLSL